MSDTNTTIEAAQKVDEATKAQSSQALIVQNYCNSVLEQPEVNFSGFDGLKQFETEINTGLGAAKSHANKYLNEIQPQIIMDITNISNYYLLHQQVSSSLPPGASKSDWLDTLNALKEQADEYHQVSQGIVSALQKLNTNLTEDSSAFTKIVSDLNAAVNGDNGTLAQLDDELSSINKRIDGAIAGTVLSALAIVGGTFLTVAGAVGDIITAGGSTPLIFGGAAIIAAGIGGEVGSAVALKTLIDEKNTVLQKESSLKAEVILVTGISSAYTDLRDKVNCAVTASQQMENAWGFLGADLGTLASDFDKGIIANKDILRTLWLKNSEQVVQKVLNDTTIIKNQMTGVSISTAPSGVSLGDYIVSLANQHAA